MPPSTDEELRYRESRSHLLLGALVRYAVDGGADLRLISEIASAQRRPLPVARNRLQSLLVELVHQRDGGRDVELGNDVLWAVFVPVNTSARDARGTTQTMR